MKQFQLGQTAATKRTFTHEEIVEYASLTGTDPSSHCVPGPLLGGMFSYLLGTQLPGRGTNYLKQHLEFPAPALVDEELFATVEIIRLRPEKELVDLKTTCTDSSGHIVCQGHALVLVKDVT